MNSEMPVVVNIVLNFYIYIDIYKIILYKYIKKEM